MNQRLSYNRREKHPETIPYDVPSIPIDFASTEPTGVVTNGRPNSVTLKDATATSPRKRIDPGRSNSKPKPSSKSIISASSAAAATCCLDRSIVLDEEPSDKSSGLGKPCAQTSPPTDLPQNPTSATNGPKHACWQ
ncbi:hypothetical protein FLONG3_10177 [Fusarium longipes]|uniref:Uncharacterized protein n=1 Tax=Fusarium longipes TaxID=694270 RepID=A0A395RQW3_9HYPO|nr:hypothetical protein FLONG3_10177 [Fusarium longipes]